MPLVATTFEAFEAKSAIAAASFKTTTSAVTPPSFEAVTACLTVTLAAAMVAASCSLGPATSGSATGRRCPARTSPLTTLTTCITVLFGVA